MRGAWPLVFLVAAGTGCGARTPLAEGTAASSDAAISADATAATTTLSVVLGTYTGCTTSSVTRRPNLVGGSGGAGSLTLRRQGDTVVASLDFAAWAHGDVAFAPTTAATAGLRAAQSYEVQIIDTVVHVVTVNATAGSLAVVGSTLFLATHGTAGDDDVSTFFHCRVPPGIAPTDIVTTAPPPGRVTAGTYASCTASSSTEGPLEAGISGGLGAVTLTAGAGGLHLAWPDSLLQELACNGLDFGAASVAPTLTAGQTCTLRQPCGPPPTLGMSPYPSTATLTDLRGAVTVNRGALFIDVLGDAGAQACGVHDLLITCVAP